DVTLLERGAEGLLDAPTLDHLEEVAATALAEGLELGGVVWTLRGRGCGCHAFLSTKVWPLGHQIVRGKERLRRPRGGKIPLGNGGAYDSLRFPSGGRPAAKVGRLVLSRCFDLSPPWGRYPGQSARGDHWLGRLALVNVGLPAVGRLMVLEGELAR